MGFYIQREPSIKKSLSPVVGSTLLPSKLSRREASSPRGCSFQAQLFYLPWFAVQTRSLSLCSGSHVTMQVTACAGQVWGIVLPLRNPGFHTVVSCLFLSSPCQCLLCSWAVNPFILQHKHSVVLDPLSQALGNSLHLQRAWTTYNQ